MVALANAAISAVFVRGCSVAGTVFRCLADGRDGAAGTSPSSAAVAKAAIRLVRVLGISVVMAVGLSAWRRCCTIGACPAIVAHASAAIDTVHVSCHAMTSAVEFTVASWRSGAILAGVCTMAIRRLHAVALTTICLIVIFSCAVCTAIIICITRWWDGAFSTSPAFCANAVAAIITILILSDTVRIAMML